jgi:hypothetical protein
MCGKILTGIIILIALILAIAASVLPAEQLGGVIMVSRFFDVMLPVLGVGALIKYISCCSKKCSSCAKSCASDKNVDSTVR